MGDEFFVRGPHKRSFIGALGWVPVACTRGSVVYRSYVCDAADRGWFVLLAGFSEQELLFLDEKSFGPYDTATEAYVVARSVAARRVYGGELVSPGLVKAIDSYVDALALGVLPEAEFVVPNLRRSSPVLRLPLW